MQLLLTGVEVGLSLLVRQQLIGYTHYGRLLQLISDARFHQRPDDALLAVSAIAIVQNYR